MSDTAIASEAEAPPQPAATPTGRTARVSVPLARMGDPHERLVLGCVLLGAVVLEVLPPVVVLLVISGMQGPQSALPLPVWWMSAIVLLAWGAAALHGALHAKKPNAGTERRAVGVASQALVLLSGGVSIVLSFTLAGGAVPGIALLAGYLWWRGLLLGRSGLTRDRLYRWFVAGFLVLILALAIVGTLSGPARASLEGALALLLPCQMFVGLGAVVLAHLCDTAREHLERQQRMAAGQPPAAFRLAWVRTAVSISATVVLPALLLALALSANAIQMISASLGWLAQALLRALFFALGPLLALLDNSAQGRSCQNHTPLLSGPAQSRPCQQYSPPQSSWKGNLPHIALDVGALVCVVLALIIVALMLRHVLRRFGRWAPSSGVDEARERMSARDVLRRQFHSLLTGRRHRSAAATDEEMLAIGSVRYRYREVLRVAQTAGHGREGNETPDEYARRMPAAAPGSAAAARGARDGDSLHGALATLTEAYNTARYRDPRVRDQAPERVTSAQQAILRWLATKEPRTLSHRHRRHGDR